MWRLSPRVWSSKRLACRRDHADLLVPERVRKSKLWIERGRAKRSSDLGPCDLTLGIPTFVGDDVDALRQTARQNLVIYTYFPFFQHVFRASGFTAEADSMEQGAGAESLSNELLDSICLIGPLDRCKRWLDEYRKAGVDFPTSPS